METETKHSSKQLEITRSTLKALRKQETTCDVTLVCGESRERLRAHRLILRAGTTYFETMFSSGLKEASSNEVSFPTINGSSMALILEFIYLQKINIRELSGDEMCNLLPAAHLLDINPLVEMCAEELRKKITMKNWGTVLEIARKYSLDTLVSAVVQHLPHFNLIEGNSLMSISVICFNAILTNSTTRTCFRDGDLVELILRWASYDKPDRKNYLTQLFSAINFAAVPKSVITKLTDHNDLFIDNPSLSLYLLKKITTTAVQPVDLKPDKLTTSTNATGSSTAAIRRPKLFLFTPRVVYVLDLTDKTWSTQHLPNYIVPEQNSPIAVSDEAVYIATYQFTNNTLISAFSPYGNRIVEIATNVRKSKFGMVILDNALYVVGGDSYIPNAGYSYIVKGGHFYTSSSGYFESLDLKTKQWRRHAEPLTRRLYPTLVTLLSKIYMFGGSASEYSAIIRDIDVYCLSVSQWTTITTLPINFTAAFTVAPCLSKIYIATKQDMYQNQVLFEYDPVMNSLKQISINCPLFSLCGSGKPLEYLIFEIADTFCQIDLRTQRRVTIAQRKQMGGRVVIFP